jgi:peptide/nickel transport system permease protein
MKRAAIVIKWAGRTFAIILLVMIGSTMLVRFAPGYLSDAREMDAHYAHAARTELSAEAARSGSIWQMLLTEAAGMTSGSAGVSRQFGVPVLELIRPRLAVTGSILLRSLVLGWLLALCASLITSAGKKPRMLWQAPATLLLAIPTAAMATLCLLAENGGPVLVMALLLAARDFKFLHRLLRTVWLAPHLLHARALGIRPWRLLAAHILPNVVTQLAALASLSLVTALSAIVPVEVIFNVPGVGQLAWNAALNRDLPVLLAVTLLMAVAVACSGIGPGRAAEWGRA